MHPLRIAVALFFLGAGAAFAGYGQDDPRLEKLYGSYIAPCCWRENLSTHDSPTADALRARIHTHVEQGMTDEQIKAVLVNDYGARILALPEGSTRTWLFWTPVAALLVGLGALLLWLKRARRPQPALAGIAPADLPDDWDKD